MAGRLQLENFHPSQGAARPKPASASQEVEKKLLEAYEHGYKAGWDDATQAHVKENAKVGADFARNIQEMSFTYHEVQSNILGAVEPLLREMVTQVLPVTAAETLGQTILDALRPMTQSAVDAPVELVLHPENRSKIAPLLETSVSLPLTIVEEDTLGSGQIFLRVGQSEKSIDMEEVLTAVSQAVEAFFASGDPELPPVQSEISNAG